MEEATQKSIRGAFPNSFKKLESKMANLFVVFQTITSETILWNQENKMAWLEVIFNIRPRKCVPGTPEIQESNCQRNAVVTSCRASLNVASYSRVSSHEETPSLALWRVTEAGLGSHW